MPVALNCWVAPSPIDEFAGATAIETNAGPDTLSAVAPATEPKVAVTVAVPIAWALARPAPLTVAMPEGETRQATVLVRSGALPSLYLPIAANCCELPLETVGLGGAIAIETKTAGETVSLVELLRVPDAALTIVVPDCLLTAIPGEVMAATVGCVLFHDTFCVMSCWLPSLNEPVTVNCSLLPNVSTGLAGEIESDLRVLAAGVVPADEAPGSLLPPQPDRPIANEKSRDAAARFFPKRIF